MQTVMTYLGPAVMLAVLGVLVAGIWNMSRGGSASRSQMLMRWRVILQFVAIIVLMATLYFFGN
tara:strand:- start:318 stop:509 length:192 start_codon:yes stop_codon:yes gene_type:complete